METRHIFQEIVTNRARPDVNLTLSAILRAIRENAGRRVSVLVRLFRGLAGVDAARRGTSGGGRIGTNLSGASRHANFALTSDH
jgi:hypothetical protein